ncbi:MAG: MaoC family dehydratase [Bacteroidales bacterium]|nr:MaoC family dehydratase [Bacteroidales bacterium]
MTITELARESGNITHIYKVTPDVYYSFQRCSNDFNPLHTDLMFAKRKGHEGLVMYGNILNAFVSHFVGMLLPARDVMIQTQDISFHKPVFLNDEIRLEASVDNVSEAVNIIQYKLKFYRIASPKDTLVAKGHVQIGLI